MTETEYPFPKKEYPYTIWVNGKFHSHAINLSKARLKAYELCSSHPRSSIDIIENNEGRKGKKIATLKNNGIDILKKYYSYSSKKYYYIYKDKLYDYTSRKMLPNQPSTYKKSKSAEKAVNEYTISDWNREEKAKTIDEARIKAASMVRGGYEGKMAYIKHGYRKELNGTVFRKGTNWIFSPDWKGKPRYFNPITGRLKE